MQERFTTINKLRFVRPDVPATEIVDAIKRNSFGKEWLERNPEELERLEAFAENPTRNWGLSMEVRRAGATRATVYVRCTSSYETPKTKVPEGLHVWPMRFEIEVNSSATSRTPAASRAHIALLSEATDLACLLEVIASDYSNIATIIETAKKEE